ncbi:PAS domain S-box protein [Azospirillum sp. RWY-5-1]|uniref:histidine kinase n=1 Tax=Azospirillum oleiclasticum TaxID=2735135 RepID=A0ABX2TLZ6_9PROT|nr:PAS domain S-box protein [Azospirillum oleiclasticum]NYZ16795.1 PAS domain S-box protein [Azospirillum oleiclasticum]NYZ24471.1 PAS domain S-box protein [Azospirillum oleiclasticum]
MRATVDPMTPARRDERRPSPFSRPLRVRTWLVLLVMAVALPLVLFSAILLVRNVSAQAEETERQVLGRARLLAEDVDREVARLIAAAEILATSDSLASGDLEAFHRRAIHLRDRLGTNVVLRDLANQQLVNTRVPWGTPLPVNSGFEADRRAIETRSTQVSGIIIGGLTRVPLLIVVAPVIGDGEVRYLLSLTIALERLQAIVSPERLPPGWRAGVIDRDGIVIARSHQADQFVGKPLPDALWAGMREAPDGIHRAINLESVAAFQAYSRARTSGWVVATSVPQTLLAEPARRILLLFAGGGVALLLVGIGVAMAVGRRLTRPVAQLALAAEALGAGRLPAAEGGGVVEIDAVGRAIQDAASLIRTREAALADSEARYRAIVQTAVDAVVVIDEAGSIHAFNPAAEQIFGYAADEVVGRDVTLLLPDASRAVQDARLADHDRAGGSRILGTNGELVARHKDGTVFPIELSVAGWTSAGRRYVTETIRNISKRKQAEDALRASKAEADRANIAKSKFLAAASHDLRQPIQAMMLFQAALVERLGDHPASSLLKSMGEAMGGLRMLLDSLLDVSKLDAGLIVPQPVDMAVGPLLERLGAEYHPRALARGLRLRIVACAATIRSDPALLERILRNLVENALRYTESGGVLIGCRRRGDRLLIGVVDSGIGIDPDRQEEIFEEFVQLGNPERDRNKGLGLGLAVVRRLARLLGHAVEVRSAPGRGSTFRVAVPLAVRKPVGAGPREGQPAPGPWRGLILVIDDEPLVRMGLQAMLEGWGYQVLTAGSIEDAVRHVESGTWPGAILADYRLRGGETGLDAIRAVYERLDTPVPATVITGDTAPERLVEVRAGGHGLLHKPIAAHELRNAVLEMLPSAE